MDMKNGNYYITQEQLEAIEHYKRMFGLNAEAKQNKFIIKIQFSK